MIFLFLSILCSSTIFIIFRSFEKYQVNTFGAIVINYLIASITGFLSLKDTASVSEIAESSWFFNALLLGVIFIALFNLMARASQELGASVASVSNKMALVLPVTFAIFYYGDSASALKITGILSALVGVYLSTIKPKAVGQSFNWKLILLPLIIFVGSGFIDTFIKFNQEFYLRTDKEASLFSSLIFLTAFFIGIAVVMVNKKHRRFSKNTIIGGLILGVVNYGSIYFLIQTFNSSSLESSVVFPINNMGVVLLTTVSSYLIFRERFSTKNKVGILISIISIILISISV